MSRKQAVHIWKLDCVWNTPISTSLLYIVYLETVTPVITANSEGSSRTDTVLWCPVVVSILIWASEFWVIYYWWSIPWFEISFETFLKAWRWCIGTHSQLLKPLFVIFPDSNICTILPFKNMSILCLSICHNIFFLISNKNMYH